MSKSPCNCPVCQAVDHAVYAKAPSSTPDPWDMEPGDTQRALAVIYEARQRELGKSEAPPAVPPGAPPWPWEGKL